MYFVGDYIQILHCLDLIQYEMIFLLYLSHPPPIKNMFIYTFIYTCTYLICLYTCTCISIKSNKIE